LGLAFLYVKTAFQLQNLIACIHTRTNNNAADHNKSHTITVVIACNATGLQGVWKSTVNQAAEIDGALFILEKNKIK
jgi:hypothetical protein